MHTHNKQTKKAQLPWEQGDLDKHHLPLSHPSSASIQGFGSSAFASPPSPQSHLPISYLQGAAAAAVGRGGGLETLPSDLLPMLQDIWKK